MRDEKSLCSYRSHRRPAIVIMAVISRAHGCSTSPRSRTLAYAGRYLVCRYVNHSNFTGYEYEVLVRYYSYESAQIELV